MDNFICDEIVEKYKKYINPSLPKLLYFMNILKVEDKSDGLYIYDINNKPYIDCLGGYGVFNFGHRNSFIIDEVKKQLDLMPMGSKVFLNRSLAEFSNLLAEILPGDIKYSFVVNSGAEAVEGALKLAKLYTGKSKIIAMLNGFHGKTLGALSATGRELYRDPFKPLLQDFFHVPFNDIESLCKILDKDTAAIIVEPIQGEGGIIVPDTGYLNKVKQLCEEYNCLLICDEIQTGMGRTGKFFAVNYDEVVPDIILTAKALGGGIMPIGAFSSTKEIWNSFIESPFLHTSTFGGNPLACSAGIATITFMQREYENLMVGKKGKYFISQLEQLKSTYPHLIKEIRGRGLMIGVELIKEEIGGLTIAELIKRGVLVAYTLNNPKVIRLEPPFIITEKEIDQVINIFAEAFQSIEKFME